MNLDLEEFSVIQLNSVGKRIKPFIQQNELIIKKIKYKVIDRNEIREEVNNFYNFIEGALGNFKHDDIRQIYSNLTKILDGAKDDLNLLEYPYDSYGEFERDVAKPLENVLVLLEEIICKFCYLYDIDKTKYLN